jgi:heme a synthase
MDPALRRLVPRWLHIWAIVTVVCAAALLLLGEMVTTLRAGMVDPNWPTRPWHLALESRERWTAGYLVEHTHRILGFLVGGLVSVLAVAAWAYEPRKGLRWAGIVALVALLAGFGYFHGQMMAQIDAATVHLPIPSTVATLVPLGALIVVCVAAMIRPTPATGVRVLTVAAMVAVMIQGLLGGLRVRLNELVGTDLAAVHGVFATLVLSLLIAIPVLTARGPTEPLPIEAQKKLAWQTASLVLFTLVQVVFGALVRHMPDRMSARLHLFFAFVVVGFATLAIKQALADPVTKRRLNWPSRFLMALITLQILFGVEAWMGKFMTDVPVDAAKAPPIGQAILRTAHAHVGAWILALGVVFALISRRKPVERVGPAPPVSVDWQETTPRLATTGVRSPA